MTIQPKLTDRTAAYVEVFRRSVERTRVACGLVVVISVVALAAFNNLRNENWPTARLQYQAARQDRILRAIDDYRDSHPDAVITNDTRISNLPGAFDSNSREEVRSLAKDWGVQTVGQLKEFIGTFRQGVTSSNKVQIPVAGLTFDSNDMGLAFGLCFVSFSVFLYKCGRRERRATISALEQANEHGELPLAYSLMSLEEVLMRPDNLDSDSSSIFDKHNRSRAPIRKALDTVPVQSIIAWLPFVCLFLISVFDFASVSKGLIQSAVSTYVVVGIEVVSLLICLLLALQTNAVLSEICEVWITAREHVGKSSEPTTNAVPVMETTNGVRADEDVDQVSIRT